MTIERGTKLCKSGFWRNQGLESANSWSNTAVLFLAFTVILLPAPGVAFLPSNGSSLFKSILDFGHSLMNSKRLFESAVIASKKSANYMHFHDDVKSKMQEETRKMFYFGYDNYMKHAYPQDELNPIDCDGRGPDVDDPVLGALLSAHLLIVDPEKPFGELDPGRYDGELLGLAHDLASRLLPAFEETGTGLPHPRVSLRQGVPEDGIRETCASGAGSLVLEFGLLSRLLGDPVYENRARRAVDILWSLRSQVTGLTGNTVNVDSGRWTSNLSGLGAGMDSFYEYLLKSFVMFGNAEDYERFAEIYDKIKIFMRKGRARCNSGTGDHPMYVNVDMTNGNTLTAWVDSLQAAFPAVQLLAGDVEEAICHHALFYAIWKRCDATKNPFYLHVGRELVESLNQYSRARCGYATLHSVIDKSQEDRMESFFLSETCKYLYLLFDEDNYINRNPMKYLFSTEGHLFPLHYERFRKPWDAEGRRPAGANVTDTCSAIPLERKLTLPLRQPYLHQLFQAVGVAT
ncbi:ER degradation-enhancing alpha-mannosidase-like protein 1 [Amphibalanus amphitrite]|uniref:ER degradation-enhancing alpha-mannosidase-like protein 1 n=1 Tax=Amphibalanus amphitrite TaxID=1232801 RepID=A0A6A4W7V9_AMPAM|nr:ER degradation-enhancing alpha-mannosidase-like protein 1 [Amphibalanus amphitrite]